MDELTFLKQLAQMVDKEGTEYPAPWEQVSNKFKEDFMGWCHEVKKTDWTNQWNIGWSKYHIEYVRYVIDLRITELQRIRDIDYKWKKSEPSTQKA